MRILWFLFNNYWIETCFVSVNVFKKFFKYRSESRRLLQVLIITNYKFMKSLIVVKNPTVQKEIV